MQKDMDKTLRGAFLTRRSAWLTQPVRDFILSRIQNTSEFLDPFAGDGQLLDDLHGLTGLSGTGFDISGARWPHNDSLVQIPTSPDQIIVTNPPFLARHSAARKGVWRQADVRYEAGGRTDLYQIALDRCLESCAVVVAIVPETVILSGYPTRHLECLSVIEKCLFDDTETPVCVTCWDRRSDAAQRLYKGDRFCLTIPELNALRPQGRTNTDMRFNVPDGRIGFRAVDGSDPSDRIGFFHPADFGYSRNEVSHSNRLMTYLEIRELTNEQCRTVIAEANRRLESLRQQSHDLLFSPFKGNNTAGVRRRRLDYGTARSLLGQAVAEVVPLVPAFWELE